jgi:putative transposase
MLRAIKVRLYPNKTQEQTLNKVLGCYRFVYNQCLALKRNAYDDDKTNLNLTDISKWFHGTLLKDENYVWLKEQNTKVMSQSIRQMLSAYEKFFKQRNGFPKFKSKRNKQSALFPIGAISKLNTFETRHISLTKPLKNVKFRCSDLYFNRLKRNKEYTHMELELFAVMYRKDTLATITDAKSFLKLFNTMPLSTIVRHEKDNALGYGWEVRLMDGDKIQSKWFFPSKHEAVEFQRAYRNKLETIYQTPL